MKELAKKHKTYILRCHSQRTASDGTLNTQLREAYVRETGQHIASCGSCLLNTVIPAYVKLINEMNESN